MTTVAPPELRATGVNALRPHQRDAIDAVNPDLERQQIIMACGTGKTLTGQHAVAALLNAASGSVLVLVPTLTLLQQTFQAWAADAPFGFDALAVCSKLTSAEKRDIGTEDDADVDQLSLPATTDSAELARFLTGSRRGVRVVFATYQSLGVVIDAHRNHRARRWSVVLCDEAHRTAGRATKPFARALHDEHVPARRRLFLTATPRVHALSGDAPKTGPALLASMDDESLYGPAVYTLSVAEAVEREILSEYQVAVIGVEDAELHAAAQLIDTVNVDGEQLTLDHVAAIVALSKAARENDLAAIIGFFNSKKSSKSFVSAFNAVHSSSGGASDLADGTAEHIDGTMKLSDRAEALDRLAKPREGGFHLVSNAKCLTEGIDVPALDAVLFGEPRTSQIDVVQCVGRAIRRNGDRRAMIVLGVRVGAGDDVEGAVDESQFRKVRQVITALADHDPRITEAARTLARRPTTDPEPGDGPTDGDVIRAQRLLALHIPPSQLHGGFGLRILDVDEQAWERGFAELLRYVEEHGHSRVPNSYVVPETGHRLGNWVRNCRAYRSGGRLSAELVARLEALPGWTWSVLDVAWERGVAELLRYVEAEGTADVPNNHVAPDTGYRLGRWVHSRRAEYRKGKLAPERIKQLEAISGWTWGAQRTGMGWEKSFAELLRYVDVHGDADVPISYVVPETGYRLGRWVEGRSRSYRKGTLSPDRIAQLESVPEWAWRLETDPWERGFAELLRYVEGNGHSRVPSRYVVPETGYRLGNWVRNCRAYRREGKLPAELVARLEALPGWAWSVLDVAWECGVAELLRYAGAEGTADVPNSYVVPDTGYRLGRWVHTRRADHRQGKLTTERIAQLEAIPGWVWDTKRG